MLTLNKKIKAIVKKRTGFNVAKLSDMDFDAIDKEIEKKTGHKLHHASYDDDRLHGRGSVYLYLDRLINMKKINRILSRI